MEIHIPGFLEIKGIPKRNLRACVEGVFSVCLIVESAGGYCMARAWQ